jgi:hypothetical protein
MLKKIGKILSIALIAVLVGSNVVWAAYDFVFPTAVTDTSGSARSYYPVDLGFTGQAFIDAGKINANGLDTNMQIGSTDINYMLSTTKALAVIPTLSAYEKSTLDFYTGYTPAQTTFPVIVGEGGYVTVADDADMELGGTFEVEVDGYVDTSSGSNKNLVYKADAFQTYVSGASEITAQILDAYQVIVGGYNNTMALATEYNMLMGGDVWTTTTTSVQQVVPTAGTFNSLYVEMPSTVLAGATRTFTVMKNGSPTSLAVTLSEGEASGSDTSNTVSVVAGDLVMLRNTSTGSPGNYIARWSTLFTATNIGESICMAVNNGNSATTYYSMLQGLGGGSASVETQIKQPIPTSGTLKDMYVQLATNPGGSGSYTITLREDTGGGSGDTSLAVTVTEPDTTGSDTADDISVSAGDLMSLSIVPASSPANMRMAISMVFESDTLGESIILSGGGQTSANATTYNYASGNNITWGTTEADFYQLIQGGTLKNLYVSLDTSPGASKTNQFDLRIEGADAGSPSTLSVSITGGATSGNDTTNSASVSAGDTINWELTRTNTPSLTYVNIGMVFDSASSVSVTATGVSSGDIEVKVTGDGTDLKIYVDDVEEDSALLGGLTVPDNSNSWIINQNDVLPYFDYYKHTVSSTLIAWYEPNTMLTGTTLTDREGASEDGTITYGSNTNITLAYGAMLVSESIAVGTETGFDVPEATLPSQWFASGDSLSGLPFYDSFSEVANSMGMPVQTIYFIANIGFAFGVFLLLALFTRSALLAVIGFNVVLIIGSSQTIVPMWIPFAIIFVQIFIMYLYKQVAY